MSTATATRTQYGKNDYFKMGAVVAIGELMRAGYVGHEVPLDKIRSFLASFGVRSCADMRTLGMGPVYADDFIEVFDDYDEYYCYAFLPPMAQLNGMDRRIDGAILGKL